MKAISLWQPWATAMALGSKRIETRSWATKYRGPMAIHAAKRMNISELISFSSCWNWKGALFKITDHYWHKGLSFGTFVAVGNLIDCRATGSFTQLELDQKRFPNDCPYPDLYSWTERQMGDFSLGRYGWIFSDIRELDPPILWRGRQGIFNVPDEVIK